MILRVASSHTVVVLPNPASHLPLEENVWLEKKLFLVDSRGTASLVSTSHKQASYCGYFTRRSVANRLPSGEKVGRQVGLPEACHASFPVFASQTYTIFLSSIYSSPTTHFPSGEMSMGIAASG